MSDYDPHSPIGESIDPMAEPIDVTWPKGKSSAEERVLRDVLVYLGLSADGADNAACHSMLERYRNGGYDE